MSGSEMRKKSKVCMMRTTPPLNEDNIYNVHAIRRKRVYKGQLQYLINWEGWDEENNTWEPLENLENVIYLVDRFEKRVKAVNERRKRKRRENLGKKNVGGPENEKAAAAPSNANPQFEFVDDDEEAACSSNNN